MDEPEVEKSKRPGNGKFKQQRLKAWKPILTPQSVLPNILIVGIIFIAVGAALLSASNSVKEQTIDYTSCTQADAASASDPGDVGQPCGALLEDVSKGYTNHSAGFRCRCEVKVELTEGFDDDETFIYYELDEFYQNHRAYIKSRWDAQLRSVTGVGNSEACSPLYKDGGLFYAPCGLVANSIFNDTIRLARCDDNEPCTSTTDLTQSGRHISWESDRKEKFVNPKTPSNDLCDAPAFAPTFSTKLPNWPVEACKLGTATAEYNPFSPTFDSSGLGYENEDFIVWMRGAALSNFRKLYRRIVGETVSNGFYLVKIDFNFPVRNFNGKKKVVLSTVSWQGGKNPFLGIAYLVIGSLCVLSTAIFAVLVRFRSRELGSEAHLEWRS